MRAFAKLIGWTVVILSLLGGLVMCAEGASSINGGLVAAIAFASALSGLVFGSILLMLASIDGRLEDAQKLQVQDSKPLPTATTTAKNARSVATDVDPDAESKAEFERTRGED